MEFRKVDSKDFEKVENQVFQKVSQKVVMMGVLKGEQLVIQPVVSRVEKLELLMVVETDDMTVVETGHQSAERKAEQRDVKLAELWVK